MDLTPKQRRDYHTDIMSFIIYFALLGAWFVIVLAFSGIFREAIHWAVLMVIWLFGTMAWMMMMALVLRKFNTWRGRI